jgi:hypothetical protein
MHSATLAVMTRLLLLDIVVRVYAPPLDPGRVFKWLFSKSSWELVMPSEPPLR